MFDLLQYSKARETDTPTSRGAGAQVFNPSLFQTADPELRKLHTYMSSGFCSPPTDFWAPPVFHKAPRRALSSSSSPISVHPWGSYLGEEYRKSPEAGPGMGGPTGHLQPKLTNRKQSKQWQHCCVAVNMHFQFNLLLA